MCYCFYSLIYSYWISKKQKKEIHNSSKGVSFFDNLINTSYYNLPIQVVRPELILSTDDTVNYIYEGKGKEKDTFGLVVSKAISKAGTRSKYINNDSIHMCGMRVKLTYTFSAAETMAPIFD